jgi:uncharacterized protein YcnI
MRKVLVATVLALVLPPVASAHVQVLPAVAAPGDPTLFTLLVPNERDSPTVSVVIQIPGGLVPFSFEEVPGWKRSETRKADGSLDTVTWEGSLPVGSFVRFPLLARTPEQEGELRWPSIQTYADGTVVRWIGPEEADEPAAFTLVSDEAARQNAGGEGQQAPASSPAETGAAGPVEEAAAPAEAGGDGGGGNDTLALALGGAGLAVGIAALVVALRRRPERK